ncbi:Ribosomal protein S18 family protein [Theileria parva strain Muguga]|uniref:Ribosomal protein S18 n=1 Tax=Theileria parva TaxID=5875 RepID=Q4N807_THEPA|nr:Ribosomal protein S18 family protein [Theileria parva strain Muguga]EAN33901.1 Ribosomal protein S18 family protein [Theileria parva strain Muguga]|eukprot:XP_766184.1 hypothetical protein [Theileria parva strain Muguga]
MLLIKNLSLFPSCQLRFYNKLIYFKKNYAKYSVNFSFGTSRSTSPNPDNTSHTRAKNEDKTTNTRTTKRKSKNNNLSSIKVGGNDLKGVGVEYNKLYYECMNEIYDRRFEIHNIKESKTIQDLTKQEYDILNKVFNRVNNASMFSKSTSNTPNPSVKSKQYGNTGISPYWDPFKNIKNLKLQIISEYNQLKRLVDNVKLYKFKQAVNSLSSSGINFGHTDASDNKVNEDSESMYIKNENFWDPDRNKRLILNNNNKPFSFHDLHVLHNFISQDGQILPRRINMTTRKQQIQIFKAIKIARNLALFPYNNKPSYHNQIPLINPIEYMYNELFYKYKNENDLRCKTMIQILQNKYPNINYHKYLKYEFTRNTQFPYKNES